MGKKLSRLEAIGFVLQLIFVFGLAGCDKKSGEAVVIEKEHIAAREIPEPSTSQSETNTTETPPGESERPIRPDEITVDQYVMTKDERGTGKDPRALDHEQWIVKVRMMTDGRQFNAQVDQSKWDKLNAGDRVQVTYRIGKYTKTVWGADIH